MLMKWPKDDDITGAAVKVPVDADVREPVEAEENDGFIIVDRFVA